MRKWILAGVLLVATTVLAIGGTTIVKQIDTIVSSVTNGDITLTPNGTGDVIISSGTATTVPYFDASKQLVSSAVTPTELGYVSGVTSAIQTQIDAAGGTITALTGDVTASGSGSVTASIGSGVIVDADVNASAAIDASKLADGTVSSTELQYINSLSSNAQTQIDAIDFDSVSPMTTSGDIIYGGASGTGTRLAKGTDAQVLTLTSGIPAWEDSTGGGGGGSYINYAQQNETNWDIETGDTTDWSVLWNGATGTLAVTSTAANVKVGTYAMEINLAESGDVVSYDMGDPLTIGENGNCIASFYYMGLDTNVTARVWDADSSAYVSGTATLTASTGFTRNEELSFVCEGGVEYHLRFLGGGDAATGYVDHIWGGENYNVGSVDTQDVFSARIAATTGVVSQENVDWINGDCAPSGSGVFPCTLNKTYANKLNCQATMDTASAQNDHTYYDLAGSTTNKVQFRTYSEATTAASVWSFMISCQLVGSDAPVAAVKADQTDYPWTSYSPTLTGFGTTSSEVFFHRRVGENLEVIGYYTAGTVAASLASITLPDTRTINTTVISKGNTTAASGQIVGRWGSSGTNDKGRLLTATATDGGLIYYSNGGTATSLLAVNGNAIIASSSFMSVSFTVPIDGWDASTSNRVKFMVTTSADTVTGTEAAIIEDGSSTTTVTEQTGDWLSGSCTNPGTGQYTCTINSGIFSSRPSCQITALNDNYVPEIDEPTLTTTNITITFQNTGGSSVDTDFSLFCIGPR